MGVLRRYADWALALGLLAALVVSPANGFVWSLAAAFVFVSVWQRFTLHHPTRVSFDEAGITFQAGRRLHTYAWRDMSECRVRRFLVRDRVFVRIGPASTFRGRYWITDAVDGFDEVVRALEQRGSELRSR